MQTTTHTTAQALPMARVRQPNGRYTYVPVWLPVRRRTAQYVAVALQPTGARTVRHA